MGELRFSREPAAWIAALGAALALLVAFRVPGFTAESESLILAAVSALTGVLIAWRTRPIAPGLITGAGTALLEVVAYYGWHWSPEQIAGINAALLALAFLVRGVVTPVTDQAPIAPAGGQVR